MPQLQFNPDWEAITATNVAKVKREMAETRNSLDSLVYSIEKMLSENREKLSGDDVSSLETAISEARKAMELGELEGMKQAMDNLQKASHKLAEVLYSQTKTDDDQSTGADSSKSEDDVIEAEVVEEEANKS